MATTQMIRTEPTPAQPRWTSLSGTILEGGYELQDLLEASDTEARFKVRVLGDRELESVVLMFALPEAEVTRQVELWQTARALRHPNLRAPMGAGRLQTDGVSAAYVVIRRADEALSAVLKERVLSVEEASETVTSLLRALEALHLNGLAHGCVSPDVVLAVGDSIQLPAECVRVAGTEPAIEIVPAKYMAPESAAVNLTPEADVWCLGATMFEALTQKVWTEGSRDEVQALPEPFAAIARRCLQTDPGMRCALAEAAALHSGELKLTPRVRAASGLSIITEDEIPSAAAPAFEGEPKPAAASVPVPLESSVPEPAGREQPATRVFVEEPPHPAAAQATRVLIEKPPPPAEAQDALTASRPAADVDPVDLPVAATPSYRAETPPAALPAEARTAEIRGNTSPVANSSTSYIQAQPTLTSRPGREDRRRSVPEDEEKGTNGLWLLAGLALLLVTALIWALWPKHQTPAAVPHPTKAETGQPVTGQNGSAWQTHTVGPATAAAPVNKLGSDNAAHRVNPGVKSRALSSAPDAAKPAAHAPAFRAESPTVNGNVWRVILYTYTHQADAERRAKAINARHSMHVDVFSPSGGSPYLVAVAGRMSRDEAAQARRRAIAAGMAHDAYIQNYSK